MYSADYVRDAATEAGHEGLAADRPAGRGGMQEAGSEFWKGWPSQITIDRTADTETVEHVEKPRPIRSVETDAIFLTKQQSAVIEAPSFRFSVRRLGR